MLPRHEFSTNADYNEYLRTYFSGLFLQSLIRANKDTIYLPKSGIENLSEKAVSIAISLIVKLNS